MEQQKKIRHYIIKQFRCTSDISITEVTLTQQLDLLEKNDEEHPEWNESYLYLAFDVDENGRVVA